MPLSPRSVVVFGVSYSRMPFSPLLKHTRTALLGRSALPILAATIMQCRDNLFVRLGLQPSVNVNTAACNSHTQRESLHYSTSSHAAISGTKEIDNLYSHGLSLAGGVGGASTCGGMLRAPPAPPHPPSASRLLLRPPLDALCLCLRLLLCTLPDLLSQHARPIILLLSLLPPGSFLHN